MKDGSQSSEPGILLDSRSFFTEMVNEACSQTNIETYPQTNAYIVDLLIFYMNTENLYDESVSGRKSRGTLAELYLKAGTVQGQHRIELLKKLGDTALYVSGFFGESLQRKIVDIDYYMEMGEAAYGSLASSVEEDTSSMVFKEISRRFIKFVDVLTYISSKSIRPAAENLLQVYERYLKTGSELARDQLFEQGLIAVPNTKQYKQ